MYKSIQVNNPVFAEAIAEAAQRLAGIQSNQPWEWCLKENSTYLDCPISNNLNKSLNMIVAVFNPSPQPTLYTSIAVPHGNLDVKVYNFVSQSFVNADSSVLCDNETLPNG